MKGKAQVFLRRGTVFVTSNYQTDSGFWVEQEPYLVVSEADTSRLSAYVLEALDASRLGVPNPDDPNSLGSSRLPELAGVRNYSTFMKGAVAVDVSRSEQGSVRVVPMRNGGSRKGFQFLRDLAIEVGPASKLKLSPALEKALKDAD